MRVSALMARISVTAVLSLALAVAGAAPAHARAVALDKMETDRLLALASEVPEGDLKGLAGMTSEAVSRIVAYRSGGKRFTSIEAFRQAAGLTDAQFEKLAVQVRSIAQVEKEEATERTNENQPAPRQPAAGRALLDRGREDPARASGTPTLDLEVKGGYYSILPGYDLTKVAEDRRKVFLDTINREMCTCGCKNETLAHCLVNDPGCPVVRARVKKIYTDIVGSPPTPPAR